MQATRAQKAIGILMLVTGIAGVILSIAGIAFGLLAVNRVAAGLDDTLSFASRGLDTVEASLVQTRTTLEGINSGLDTVIETVTDASQLLELTNPVADAVAQLVSKDIPEGVDAVGDVISEVAQAAKSIDSVSKSLKDIGQRLGIELDVGTSLEEPINEVGTTLDALSRDIRSMGNDLNRLVENEKLATTSQNATTLGKDLVATNNDLTGFAPLLDEYTDIVRETRDAVRHPRASIRRLAGIAKLIIIIAMIWMGLSQIAPLYLGRELVTGQRGG